MGAAGYAMLLAEALRLLAEYRAEYAEAARRAAETKDGEPAYSVDEIRALMPDARRARDRLDDAVSRR